MKIFISYWHGKPDEELADHLEDYLRNKNYDVFIDKKIVEGEEWPKRIEDELFSSNIFIVLISQDSAKRPFLRQEIETAYEIKEKKSEQILILPIKNFNIEINELDIKLRTYLSDIEFVTWANNTSFEVICEKVINAIEIFRSKNCGIKSKNRVTTTANFNEIIKYEKGPMKLSSKYYIRRNADDEIEREIKEKGNTIILKGPSRIGKTSLLYRAESVAKKNGQMTFYCDFRTMTSSDLQNIESLFNSLYHQIIAEFKLPNDPNKKLDNSIGIKDSFTYFIESDILKNLNVPVVLIFDEVDKLFFYPYCDDFFVTIRNWHTIRNRKKEWDQLNIVIAHSTESTLFMPELNPSPLSLGTLIELYDLTFYQLNELNEKYRAPLKNKSDIEKLMRIIGGQPELIQMAFCSLANKSWSVSDLDQVATNEAGPFSSHLKHFLRLLQTDKKLEKEVREVLKSERCSDDINFQRLLASGLVTGETRHRVHMRFPLYENYFRKHLL